MVHQVAIHYRLAVAVNDLGLTKDLHRVQGRGGGQADLDCITHLDDTAIFRDVIVEIQEAQLPIAQFPIQKETPMAFIHSTSPSLS